MTDQKIETDVNSSNQRSFLEEMRREMRKQVAGAIVRWALIVGGGLFIFTLVCWWLYLKPYMIVELGVVSRGGVLAFDRDDLNQDKCPPGCPAGRHFFWGADEYWSAQETHPSVKKASARTTGHLQSVISGTLAAQNSTNSIRPSYPHTLMR